MGDRLTVEIDSHVSIKACVSLCVCVCGLSGHTKETKLQTCCSSHVRLDLTLLEKVKDSLA